MEVLGLVRSIPVLSILHPQLPQITQKRTGVTMRTFARKEFAKQSRKRKQIPTKSPIDNNNGFKDESFTDSDGDEDKTEEPINNLVTENSITYPARSTVLQTCTFTSALIAGLGLIIRQVSHVAAAEGLPILDCATQVTCMMLIPYFARVMLTVGFEIWHVELVIGLVLLISSSRYLLLKAWPDFAESSEAANEQVLTSLQPLDYLVVAFLTGISEELLFRGALLPLFGIGWKSALLVAAIFGVLHLGSGRKYSFAVWATFVGLLYGYATIASSNVVVPMASHALNNLVGGIIWRYTSKSPKQT